jgi:hypothetical protein
VKEPIRSGELIIDDPIRDEQAALSRSLKELADLKFALDESAIVVVTDANGVITYVNDTFCEISRYSREELLGKTHRIVNSDYHGKEFFKEMWDTIADGKVWRGEIRNKAKDGSYYWVDTTIVPFMDERSGKPYQYIAVRKDITYLKRIEKELRLLNEGLEDRVRARTTELEEANAELSETLQKLQESERMRETFVSALTHDLRTPLVAERRVLELIQMQRQHLPEKLQSLAERLLKNNDDLLEMVNKLLEIYQYEAGQIHLLIESVSIRGLAEDTIDKLSPLAEAKGITLENQVPQTLGRIDGDADQLKRVLVNLVGNAIQHLREGDGIVVAAEESLQELTILVRDTGPGIPPDVLPHLFDRYFVVEQTRKKIGSGLGLSICKMIARLHGGTIRVESVPGEGTVFYIKLPKRQDLKL